MKTNYMLLLYLIYIKLVEIIIIIFTTKKTFIIQFKLCNFCIELVLNLIPIIIIIYKYFKNAKNKFLALKIYFSLLLLSYSFHILINRNHLFKFPK